ncbi:MAG: long-chain fatty acid transporter [Sphingobacteriales bacterium 17-39-43]|uniref:DUF2490 domain-containing protein n=1 Tax=Daejeonella sp. TaxID=2805397 RepID=UPI000BC76BAE|nr:DUF2490 domain-containing protein [Daejeonella sp.]OYY01742.1 MAG: long-chain fatty acid transporter [Sphingobacteriia bacterium 35-40-5]OYZ32139.1 MAG: long-chain fatty acid transporter [Sphingobacteriales bacterium 16-39-50]OZA25483.1 MAG: long-chain fatty acid transporter [Sphingobacteriales bacterium 17-39-43]HQT22250.1 DUF2490 domain-containing protein [Daejeonella sp.]HQT57557.1 DUF2490 domain-containing protein [Daejeonella sp.]
MKKLIFASLLSLFTIASFAQNTRITDPNTIGWLAYTGTIRLNQKWGLHTEVQLRRDRLASDPQQNLFRAGVNYTLNNKVGFRVGYALAETYNYGDIPLNNLGKQFTEHRIYQMATLNDKSGIFEFSHRFMLEQRWIGRYTNASLTKEDDFVYWNRMRYMFRTNIPLKGRTISDKTPYLAVYDEILIGFGKNVNENIFDQNRLAILLGYRFSPKARIEVGYLNQIAQLSREVNGRNVFQDNKGVLLSTILNF